MMDTWNEGWKKECSLCGGKVRFVENCGERTGCTWLLICDECNADLSEEQVIWEKEGEKR